MDSRPWQLPARAHWDRWCTISAMLRRRIFSRQTSHSIYYLNWTNRRGVAYAIKSSGTGWFVRGRLMHALNGWGRSLKLPPFDESAVQTALSTVSTSQKRPAEWLANRLTH